MTPEQKEANQKRVLDKYHNDPVYRANALQRAAEQMAQKKEENARLKAAQNCNKIVNP
jgi:acyl-CoA reductase-like NAD-dependent aldehyde dehydrogenase